MSGYERKMVMAYIKLINKIYKVDYYKSLSNVSTKEWIDKSSQLIDLLDRDAFHIKIQNKRLT
jgi:hypothetical protein